MYPPTHDYERQSGDQHHPAGPFPASGSAAQPYAPPYIASGVRAHAVAGKWSTGLCHCCDDPANCLITCFCPCITFGQIADIVSRGSSPCAASGTLYGVLLGFTGLACLYSCFYRSKLRAQYDLDESPCVDCLVHFCCETCALCQEYRELKNRGVGSERGQTKAWSYISSNGGSRHDKVKGNIKAPLLLACAASFQQYI